MKKYQPERTDLLINTDWGIPSERLSGEEAEGRGLKLFHQRWVSKEEKKQLREEYGTYHSIRMTGGLLIFFTFIVLINIGGISGGRITPTLLALVYAFVMLAAGIGLITFRLFGRNMAVLVFLSFFVLPFTPLFENDKGAPLLIMLGIADLYYLLRKTARKIFAPPAASNPDDAKRKSSVVRKAVYTVFFILALFAGYFVYDLNQAKCIAADVCRRADKGMPLDEFVSSLSAKDYRIIRGAEYTMIVPKRGMGRYHCIVYHDGRRITGSMTGLND
jgi:hypothetical protein